ncbi:type II toxin-antitoxin system RelE/ParE family toxin [Rhodospirillum sp. A1_3_36]|uniref:type II toxin-antitoxin system RelE/ParE family toxin n=1 Tax=Rhodospirillum sp. A1_3_36 TaxID=3391666 RepID=UPI0039A6D442
MVCRFTAAAESDLDAIVRYIGQDNPERAVSFVNEIIEACQQRAAFPRMSRRRLSPKGTAYTFPFRNYIVIHRVLDDGTLLVLRVVHAARDAERFL